MTSSVQTLLPATQSPARSTAVQPQTSRPASLSEPACGPTSFQDALGQASRKEAPRQPVAAKSDKSSKKQSQPAKSRRGKKASESEEGKETAGARKAKRGPAKHPDAAADATDESAEQSVDEATPAVDAKVQSGDESDKSPQDPAAVCASGEAAAQSAAQAKAPEADGSTEKADADAAASGQAKVQPKATVRPAVAGKKPGPQDADAAQPTDEASTHTSESDATEAASAKDVPTEQSDEASVAPVKADISPIRLGGAALTRKSTSPAMEGTAIAAADASAASANSQAAAQQAPVPTPAELLDSQAGELMAAVDAIGAQKASKPDAPQQDAPPAIEPATSKGPSNTAAPKPAAVPQPPPETRFADVNHPRIITGVRGELLPNGGSMHLRLDPPELGDLQVTVQMRDGMMTAAFQTSNEQATRLLSHSLGDLKAMLESQGVSVQKLHVEQAPRDQQDSSSDANRRQGTPEEQHSSQRDQQRKEMIQKMWDKMLRGGDPVDLVA